MHFKCNCTRSCEGTGVEGLRVEQPPDYVKFVRTYILNSMVNFYF